MAQITSLTNANVYVGDNNYLGTAKSVKLPKVDFLFEEKEILGLVGTPEFFTGIGKMEATLMVHGMPKDSLKQLSNPTQVLQVQVRASQKIMSSSGIIEEQKVIAYLTATPKNIPEFSFEPKKEVEGEVTFAVTAYKLVIGTDTIYDINILANIMRIANVNILAKYNSNLGI